MKTKANILKSIFLRKGGNGNFTVAGCIIPDNILKELGIKKEQVIISYFKDDQEWCALTDEFVYFKNFQEPSTISLRLNEIYDVKPFSVEQTTTLKPPYFDRIFITSKNKKQFGIYWEKGSPLHGVLQVFDYISHQNAHTSA